MCSQKSIGTKFERCGHYQPTEFYDKRDCGFEFCVLSRAHNPRCVQPYCQCDHDWDPDHEQRIVDRDPGPCHGCFAYFTAATRNRHCHDQEEMQHRLVYQGGC